MDEPALDAEGLHGPQTGRANVVRQILDQIIDGVAVVVDNIHNGPGGNIAGLKQRLSFGIHNGVVGLHIAPDKLFHDVHGIILVLHKEGQLLVGLELVGVVGAYAVVGLDHNGIAHGVCKIQSVIHPLDQVIPGGGETCLGVVFLHGGLILDFAHIAVLGTGGDVEFGAQPGIPHEPVFVVGFQPVNLAVFEGEEGHGLKDLVVIFQTGYLVVFMETVPQLLQQVFVGAVADAQHPHAILLQFGAELPVGHGEIGGDKNKVLHKMCLSFCIAALPQTGEQAS